MNRFIRMLALAAIAGPAAMSTVSTANEPMAADVESIDSIINAYYNVISGPEGYQYDAERDRYLHAPNAVITRTSASGTLQRHDLATEQKPLETPYHEAFYEQEIGRIVEHYGHLAHVWSTYEIRNIPDGEALDRGVNSISLYYHEGRWWIASWSTQLEGETPLPTKYLSK